MPHTSKTFEWTYDAFMQLPEDGYRYEILDGVLVREPPAGESHQSIVRELVIALGHHLGPAGRRHLYDTAFAVRLDDGSVVQPDVVYMRPDRGHMVSDTAMEGTPDLAIEILSPSSRERDLIIKRRVYARHGVAEYWIIDPVAGTVEVLSDPGGETYGVHHGYARGDTVQSAVFPGIELRVDHLLGPYG